MSISAAKDCLHPSRLCLRSWLGLLWVCGAAYGISLGMWRSPWQGLYTGIKFPLLLSMVILGNALLNTVSASVLGIPLRFRETLHLLSACYGVFTLILAACVPVFLFLTFSVPASISNNAQQMYQLHLLLHVLLIAVAGVASHLRQFETLVERCGKRGKAQQLMFCWLTANLLLGAQLSWNLRPFFGTPRAEVEFLREDPFDRNFFEALYQMAASSLQPHAQE